MADLFEWLRSKFQSEYIIYNIIYKELFVILCNSDC